MASPAPREGGGVLLKLLFNPSDFGLVKKLLPSKEIAAGPAIRIYVFFICNIPFSRFINGKCFVGQCGELSPSILKKPLSTLCGFFYEIVVK